jgi:hypothetical protein
MNKGKSEKSDLKQQKLIIPEPYNSNDKITKLMNTMNANGDTISHWTAYDTAYDMFYMYLFKKYKTTCFSSDTIIKLDIEVSAEKPNITAESKKIYKAYANKLCACINAKKEMVVMPIRIGIFGQVAGKKKQQDIGAHANVMIYRKRTNQIEHFEPHGSNFKGQNGRALDVVIKNNLEAFVAIVNKILGKKVPPIKFVHSSEVCINLRLGKHGFQSYEEQSTLVKILEVEGGGYCAVWSMFFTELCLKNPKFSSRQIMEMIDDKFLNTYLVSNSNQLSDYLRKLIRGYSNFINEKLFKYFSILFGKDITMEKIKEFTDNKDENSLRELRQIINTLMEYDNANLDDKLKEVEKAIEFETKRLSIIEKRDELKDDGKFKDAAMTERLEIAKRNLDVTKRAINKNMEILVAHKNRTMKIRDLKFDTPVSINEQSMNSKIWEPDSDESHDLPVKKYFDSPEINIVPLRKVKTAKKLSHDIDLVDDIQLLVSNNPKRKIKIIKPKKTAKNIPEIKACPDGKVLNPLTNRCIKIKLLKTAKNIPGIKACPEGKILNPLTNRCIKIKN